MGKFQLFSLLLVSSYVAAQDDRATDPNNHFNNPPPAGKKVGTDPSVYLDNVVFPEGVATTFEWVTSSSDPLDIRLVKEGPENHQLLLCSDTTATSCPWNGDLGGAITLSTQSSDVFFLGAWDSVNTGGPLFYSHYFNISRAAKGSASGSTVTLPTMITSSATSTPTVNVTITSSETTTTTTASTTSGSSVRTSSSSTSSASSQATQMNSATAIGAGVGAGIGGAILILGALFFLWYRKHQKNKHTNGGLPSHQPPPFYDINQTQPAYAYYPSAQPNPTLYYNNNDEKQVYQHQAAELAPSYSQHPPGAELSSGAPISSTRSELSGELK